MRFTRGLLFSIAALYSGLLRADAASVGLTLDPFCGLPRVAFEGAPGDSLILEGSDSVLSTSWTPLLNLTLTEQPTSWCDSEKAILSRRFYRAIQLSAPPPLIRPRNFRLLDQEGKSRELYYSFNDPALLAYVLVFTGDSATALTPVLPTLNRLVETFTPLGTLFWGISSSTSASRSNLLAETKSLKLSFPILHDQLQLVTREFAITRAPEVVVIKNGTFEILYRGAIEEAAGDQVQNYLELALNEVTAGNAPALTQVRPLGAQVELKSLATANYSKEIAPLLQARCVTCHSPGNIAPWAMTNHAIVSDYAFLMKDEILAKRMPPWHADPEVGHFSNDSSLTPDEASKLVHWISQGAPRGEGPDPLEQVPPPPPAWVLGTPDMILSIPTQSLPATGDIDYRYLTIDPKLPTNAWLRAAVVRPGNRKVVHHSLVFLGDAASSLGGLSGYFAGYVPGLDQSAYPGGAGKLLPKGNKLTFQMHYVSTGVPETDTTQLGLYFMAAAPQLKFQTKAAFDVAFQIPPGASEHITTAQSSPFTKNSWLYEMSPHQHLRGKWFNYDLVLSNGTRTPIIRVPRYQFNWQRLYRLETPLFIPAGARIVCTGSWDNSPQNLSNPDSQSSVSFGEQTYEEMFIGYYNYAEAP